MQKVLVAGGAGFLGTHLCKLLLDQSFEVISLDSLITGRQENVDLLKEEKNYKFIHGDVTGNFENLISEKVDYIFHLASPASPNEKSAKSYMSYPIETLMANSLGTYNLLKLAQKYHAKFLFASSSEVYGDPKESPQKEEYLGNVSPNGPRSVYDEGKRFGEAMTMAWKRKYSVDTRIIRIFNTYGPYMAKDDGRVVSNFINQALNGEPLTVYGDGSQTRSFCYVSDLVRGVGSSMFIDETEGAVINLGNPEEKTILDFANLIKKLIGSKSEIIFEKLPTDDPTKRKPDISKAKNLLKWEPKVSLDEGLLETIEYFKSL